MAEAAVPKEILWDLGAGRGEVNKVRSATVVHLKSGQPGDKPVNKGWIVCRVLGSYPQPDARGRFDLHS